MGTNTLRIGNYLENGDRVCIVCAIFKSHFKCETLEQISLENSLQLKYNAIPIAEELLLKFGFENGIEEMVLYGKNIVVFWRKFEGHFEINGEKYFKKHIHQLQNLYYALTDEELTCKL